MKKFILTAILAGLFSAPLKTQAMESLTLGVTKNATLLAAAGALAGGLGSIWLCFKSAKAFDELVAGREIDVDLLKSKYDITSKKISSAKSLFNVLKNELGFIACCSLYFKACYYLQENVFSKKIEPDALSPIDAATRSALFPALWVGIPALISALNYTDAADSASCEDHKAMYYENANKEFKVFAGATSIVALSLLVKAIADKALNTSVEKVIA